MIEFFSEMTLTWSSCTSTAASPNYKPLRLVIYNKMIKLCKIIDDDDDDDDDDETNRSLNPYCFNFYF